jgi:putative glutamine amidotransferase
VLLTGSPSNVEPRHYGGPSYPGTAYDPARDRLSLPLVRSAVARGVPLLGICRGLQEMNVALGGSLHQRVHESGYADHREAAGPLGVQYGPAHAVELKAGGRLAAIVGVDRLFVNSLHWQGIDRLAPDCRIEARAPDGLVEAISAGSPYAFALGVQWHPEWQWREHPDAVALFAAFGDAARNRARHRGHT